MTLARFSLALLSPFRLLASFLSWLTARETLQPSDPTSATGDDVSFLQWLTNPEPLPQAPARRGSAEIGVFSWLITNRNSPSSTPQANKETS